jgi:hypothetical protein
VAAVLSGCGTPGFPRQSYDPKKQIKQVEKEFAKPELITQYFALTNAPEETKRAARDKIITGRITLINLNYNQFVAQFSVKKESLDFGTEVTELGLNLATTAAGGAETKTILGAVASGVTGSKLAVDKNFFFEKTVPVLITSMNAQRKEALLPILTGMNNNTDQYPLTQALSDLDAYYFAGTFIGALQAIQADAGSKDVQAQKNLNAVRTTKFTNDNSGILLQSYWTPKVSGTVATTTGSSSVAGIGTQFTKEIAVGDQIAVGQDMASVKTIADDAHLTAGANFTTNTNGAAYQIFSAKHQKAIEDWLSKNGMPDIAIQELINGDLFSDARKKAVQDLKIQPQQ